MPLGLGLFRRCALSRRLSRARRLHLGAGRRPGRATIRGVFILGQSDTALDRGGVRFGTAEIFRQVERIPEILEAVCVVQDWEGGQRIVLFVKLRPGVEVTSLDTQSRQIRSDTAACPRQRPFCS